jgi:hypothetical protein
MLLSGRGSSKNAADVRVAFAKYDPQKPRFWSEEEHPNVGSLGAANVGTKLNQAKIAFHRARFPAAER